MQHSFLRRHILQVAPLAFLPSPRLNGATTESFPSQSPDLVREMVTVSHGNVKRVKELVKAHPSLAKASWDWGFGDHETALGAASHVGNREIAEFLVEQGAPPTLFSATMLGHLDVVKSLIEAQPGVQKILGPHSISLLSHAKSGKDAAEPVRRYLEMLGDADGPAKTPTSETEMAALAGAYEFGAGALDRIEIKVTKGQLLFQRSGRDPRALYGLGDRTFYPAGAQAVRIKFTGTGEEMALAVYDPDLVLTARRAR